ncbi:uncharacterized protein LOC125064693 [Vanessa atalanta]|uniref:uncharacterized protein LOC125064693 n=1 Tax=Vanessa atalanta TaxID=42275 RepID=UPI001FCD766D|nr:uncharacterized protein LOC125064693 [Vanessa atalanta]
MPPKEMKKVSKTPILSEKSSIYGEFEDDFVYPCSISLSLILEGISFGPGDWIFLIIFNGLILSEIKWKHKMEVNLETLPLDLKLSSHQSLIAEQPLIFIVRITGGKGAKDPDPLLNADNRAGATVDLLPLLIGEEKIILKVPLLIINTGLSSGCAVYVCAKLSGETNNTRIPLMITMLSAHCLPVAKEGTVYLSAISLNELHDPISLNFGMSLSSFNASKIVWAAASNGGLAANTAFNIPSEDIYIPKNVKPEDSDTCNSVYWNAMNRVLIDPQRFRERINSEFLIEIAGVPRFGKIDIRGRYMAFINLGVLLEPGQFGVTVCAKLLYYNEADLPEAVGGLLDLPPTSAQISARETDLILDDYGHESYILLRFDLFEPLTAKAKIASLFEIIGFPPPQGSAVLQSELGIEASHEDPIIDARLIRNEGGALSVHKELNSLTCKGTLLMNQSIKRTAANRLLFRIRSMLKQFPPGECSNIELQDIITAQHAASRRAVTSSFAPQLPQPMPSSRIASARSRLGGDKRIAEAHIDKNLRAAPRHPRSLLSKALRCLEEENEAAARDYLLEAISSQSRNRYLLWMFGGIGYNDRQGEISAAAFRIAVKGDSSDGTTGAIGWAALHALYHHNNNFYAAFVAARKMRKSCELPREWKKFLQRWVDTSGEEEIFWMPGLLSAYNPMLIASAFFLCLRCYNFSERLLICIEEGCVTQGSRLHLKTKVTVDIFYLRAASLILRRKLDKALQLTELGIKKFGPSAIMSQMHATCITCLRGWDGECEKAFTEADRTGVEPCSWLLLQAAIGGLQSNPLSALQRAARAHKIAPSAHSALVIGRVYAKIGEDSLAERWLSAAVKLEPLLADGWAYLALLAMYDRNIDKARTLLRTAKQAGSVSIEIEQELKKVMKIVRVNALPDLLVKDLCFCEYY